MCFYYRLSNFTTVYLPYYLLILFLYKTVTTAASSKLLTPRFLYLSIAYTNYQSWQGRDSWSSHESGARLKGLQKETVENELTWVRREFARRPIVHWKFVVWFVISQLPQGQNLIVNGKGFASLTDVMDEQDPDTHYGHCGDWDSFWCLAQEHEQTMMAKTEMSLKSTENG